MTPYGDIQLGQHCLLTYISNAWRAPSHYLINNDFSHLPEGIIIERSEGINQNEWNISVVVFLISLQDLAGTNTLIARPYFMFSLCNSTTLCYQTCTHPFVINHFVAKFGWLLVLRTKSPLACDQSNYVEGSIAKTSITKIKHNWNICWWRRFVFRTCVLVKNISWVCS